MVKGIFDKKFFDQILSTIYAIIFLVNKLSLGQKKFLAEFLGNFSLAWIVGIIISPFLAGNWLNYSFFTLSMGIVNAGWSFSLALFLTKGVRS